MSKFKYYYTISLAEMVLQHTDNLSKIIQKENISAAEGQKVACLVKRTLQSLREDSHACSFWESVISKAAKLDVSEPCLARI